MYTTYFDLSHSLLSLSNFFQPPHVHFYNTLNPINTAFMSMGRGPSPESCTTYQWPQSQRKLTLSSPVTLLKSEWKKGNCVHKIKK